MRNPQFLAGLAVLALTACNAPATIQQATNGPTNPIDGSWTLAALNCSASGNLTPTGTTAFVVSGATGTLSNINGGCTVTNNETLAYTTTTASIQTTGDSCNPTSCDPGCGTFSADTQTFGYTVNAHQLTFTRVVPTGGTECPVGETSTWLFIK